MVLQTITAEQCQQQGFLIASHAEAMVRICATEGVIVTCRDTGASSLQRLMAGNPAKGHDIMSKSIKDGSIDKLVPDDEKEEVRKKWGDCFGMVGVWEDRPGEKAVPIGVKMVHDLGTKRLVKGGLTLNDPGQIQSQAHNVYTGDYDLHDILWAKTGTGKKRGAPLVSESPEEKRILERINTAVYEVDPVREQRGRSWGTHFDSENWENPFSVIRHGPQRSYYGFVLGSRDEDDIVMALLGYDAPIVGMVDGAMYKMSTWQEIQEFYRTHCGGVDSGIWTASYDKIWEKYGLFLLRKWRVEMRNNQQSNNNNTACAGRFAAWYQVSQASGLDKISQRVYSRVSSGGNQSFPLNGAAGSAMMPKLVKQLDDLQKQPWRNQ